MNVTFYKNFDSRNICLVHGIMTPETSIHTNYDNAIIHSFQLVMKGEKCCISHNWTYNFKLQIIDAPNLKFVLHNQDSKLEALVLSKSKNKIFM